MTQEHCRDELANRLPVLHFPVISQNSERFSSRGICFSLSLARLFHPCLGVRDAAGATQKLPLFLASSRCVILPAFSPFAGGYDLACGLPQELLPCSGSCEIDSFAVTSTRVVRLGPLRKAIDRMFRDVSA